VRAKVLEEVVPCKDADVVVVKKAVEDNVGRHLLQQFEEESNEEEIREVGLQNVSVPIAPMVKNKKVWGSVLATRMSSRITRDGKSAIEKA
jgi:hypothetical protein